MFPLNVYINELDFNHSLPQFYCPQVVEIRRTAGSAHLHLQECVMYAQQRS